jgi:cleavage and polyadenylation specificity factor subunit 2
VLRPDLLIVEAGRANMVNAKRRDREAALLGESTGYDHVTILTGLETISQTLQSHFSVLLPCDPSPRLLELLVLLDQHWSYKIGENQHAYAQGRSVWVYPLCVVSRTAHDMVSFARSFVEWMGGVVANAAAGLDEELTTKRRRIRSGAGESYGALDFK